MAYTNEQKKEWASQKRATRRQFAYSYLGGKCAVCGLAEDLEFDHIDPATKICNISCLWTASEEKFIA